jgi:type II secretory ATPase GspE/PulE/Tfp pilus assembly ATPase PilB-like protein
MTVAKGCAHCGRTGYYGRVGVFERLEMNAALRDSLFQMENSSDFLKSATGSSRYTPLLTDAIAKARAGLTSVSEVLRVTSVDTMAGVSATSSSQDEASNS